MYTAKQKRSTVFGSFWSILLSCFIILLSFDGCSPRSGDHVLSTKLGACPEHTDPSLMCGTVTVYENPQTQEGRMIDLNVVVIPALRGNVSKEPIFWFDGGPGIAATKGAPFYADGRNLYRREHDVVLIDIRGTGKSNPLNCTNLQVKDGLLKHFMEMFPPEAVQECYESLSEIADLSQYTTTNIAYDVEAVRQYLEYDKINLYGLSYGSRVAQVYMRMFPEAVHSSVLWSPLSLEHKVPIYHAQFAQQSIERLFLDCTRDEICNSAYPTFRQEFLTLQRLGEEGPFQFTRQNEDGEEETVTIPWHAFKTKIRELMNVPLGLRQIPYVVNQAYQGNFQPFISLFPAEATYNDYLALGLYLSIACTEDDPFIDPEYAGYLSANTFMGNYRVDQQNQACEQWVQGTVPDDFSKPLVSDIPTLVISGHFDPITPPELSEEIVKTLSQGFLITIPTMSHTFEGLSNDDCFDKMVLQFMDRPSRRPNTDCIDLMVPVAYRIP